MEIGYGPTEYFQMQRNKQRLVKNEKEIKYYNYSAINYFNK